MTQVDADQMLIDLDEVSKAFDHGRLILDRIHLQIRPHSFVSLLGPSGCGKSTLLRLIAGLSPPSQGRIRWPLSGNIRPADLSFVFQDATLMPWADVVGNVYLPLKLKGVSLDAARPRIEAALDRVGLIDFAGYFPRELSGGMRMRVSIARAMVTEPAVLLMDEPFAALDEITRHKMDEDLSSLHRDLGWTVLFVTHSVYEAVFLSERIIIMGRDPGRIIADLPVDAPVQRTRAFRDTPEFQRQCKQVSDILRGDRP